ncbi:MAG: hypothetical protein WC554_15210 [Clostridia bacterium]
METKVQNEKIGILGYGEIGKAIAIFYDSESLSQVKIKDLNRDDGLQEIDVLHICIPWSEKFVDIVSNQIKISQPKITIIHSTIAPGATKEIISGLPKELHAVVHSPCRGVHPYLYDGIKTFVKYIGAEDEVAGGIAKKHLEKLGIKTKLVFPAKTSELAKLFCTTYYGVCIAWHKEMKRICNKFEVNFDDVVTEFNKTYNEGYTKLGKSNVMRPILFVDDYPIGGHCVVPNAEILKKYFESEALDLILKYK